MIGRQVAEVLNLSLRQVRRLLAAYRKEGAQALAHGNRGRKPHHALNEGQRKRVLALAQSTYAGCSTQHFTELLTEREGIALPRYNQRFAIPAVEAGIAYRQPEAVFIRLRRDLFVMRYFALSTTVWQVQTMWCVLAGIDYKYCQLMAD